MLESITNLKTNTKILINIVFVILGVILPQMFHVLGIAGTVFLPMHIPVILTGITLGPIYGLVSGIFSPVISTFLTGMPVAFPVMPILICQLAVCGLVSGVLSKYVKNISSILLIVITQISGFITYALAYSCIRMFFMKTIQEGLSAINAYKIGIPGLLLQLVLVAGIVELTKRKIGKND